jgi:uncharacterized protein
VTPTVRQARLDPRAPLVLDAHELGRRPGTMLEVRRTVPAPADLGNGVIGVSAGSDLDLDLRLEAVMDGVLVSGTVTGEASGECVRCLDPVTERVEVDVQELFLHEPPEESDDDAELPLLDGDLIDLEPTVRDALVPALPFQPVCDPDCPGLCSRCGARLMDDPDHSHDESDPRWSALAGLALPGTPQDAQQAPHEPTRMNDGTATPAGPDRTEEETN